MYLFISIYWTSGVLHERSFQFAWQFSSQAVVVMLKSKIHFKWWKKELIRRKYLEKEEMKEEFFFHSFYFCWYSAISFLFNFYFFIKSKRTRRWLCFTSSDRMIRFGYRMDIEMKNKTQLHRTQNAHRIRMRNGIAWGLFYLWLRCDTRLKRDSQISV